MNSNIKKHLYPLTLHSSIEELKIDNKLKLRKINNQELRNYFGFKNRLLDNDLSLTEYSSSQNAIFPVNNEANHILNNTFAIFSSNFILESQKGSEDAKIFNIALKLTALGRSGIYIGFNNHTPALEFFHPNPFIKDFQFSCINNDNKQEVLFLFNLIKKIFKNDRFNLIIEKYLFSSSGLPLSVENRFLELMIILEILFLPDGNDELKYRLAIRVSKVFNKYLKVDSEKIFVQVKNYYDIRSELVHNGKSKKINKNILRELFDTTRESIILFLKNSNIFLQNGLELDKIVLK